MVRPFFFGGMGDLESRRPPSQGSFLFDKARSIAVNVAKLPVLMDRTKTEPQARRSGLFIVLALGTTA